MGTLKWFNMKKANGFITRNDTNEDVFIHGRAIMSKRKIRENESIEFDIVITDKGTMAADVSFLVSDLISKSSGS